MSPAVRHYQNYKNILLAVVMVCCGYAFANICDAALKMMHGKFSFFEICIINGMQCAVYMAIWGWYQEGKKAFRTKKPWLVFLRAALGPCSGIFTVNAIAHVKLTTYYSLVFTSPFWVVLLSSFFLKDALPKRRLVAVLLGFAAVIYMFSPWKGEFNIWWFAVLAGAFVYSIQMVIVRHLGSGESRAFMGITGSLCGFLVALPFVLHQGFTMPTPHEWLLFFIMGVTGTVSFFCIIYAFQIAPSASIIAPYHYTQIVWGAILGYFLFNEIPTHEVIVGAVLIVLSGMYLVYDETRRTKKLPADTPETAIPL